MISKRQLARGRMPDGQPNPLDVHIGNRLRLRRVYLGITQKDLATLAGISHQQIQQNIEKILLGILHLSVDMCHTAENG